MAYRFVEIPHGLARDLSHPAGIVIRLRERAVLFDVDTAAFREQVWQAPPAVEPGTSDVVQTVRETAQGPVSALSFDGRSVEIQGTMNERIRVGPHLFGVVRHPAMPSYSALIRGVELVRLPAMFGSYEPGDSRAELLLRADEHTVVRAQGQHVHCLRVQDDGLWFAWFMSPVPVADAALVNGTLRLGGRAGVAMIALDSLPWAREHVATESHYEVSVFPGDPDPTPAEVRAVLGNTALLVHPTFGTLRSVVPWEPPLEKGELVLLDDVRREAPDVYRPYALRRCGEPFVAPVAQPIHCAAPPAIAWGYPDPTPHGRNLRALAQQHRFVVPPLLDRILMLLETDRVFGHWLSSLGFHFDVHDLTEDWHTDPNLVTFGTDPAGDALSLYIYPPHQRAGKPAPVVSASTDRGAFFVAQDFDSYFEAALSEPERIAWVGEARYAVLAGLVRSRLDFPAQARPVGAAPAWFEATYDRVLEAPHGLTSPPKLTMFTRTSSLERLEREYLARFLGTKPLDDAVSEAVAALYKVYARLGWSLPLAQLEPLRED